MIYWFVGYAKKQPKVSAVRTRTDTRQDTPDLPDHGDCGHECMRTVRF